MLDSAGAELVVLAVLAFLCLCLCFAGLAVDSAGLLSADVAGAVEGLGEVCAMATPPAKRPAIRMAVSFFIVVSSCIQGKSAAPRGAFAKSGAGLAG